MKIIKSLRTRFKSEIVAEFLPPSRPTKRERVIIVSDGMPGVPRKGELVSFLSQKGFWVFYPRYRGTWESDGIFLKQSPEKDILDIIDQLPKGFRDAWSGKKYKVSSNDISIITGSFGGPAGILASRDKRVKKVVVVSPVVDWLAPSKAEPLDRLEEFVHEAFGNGYRFGKKQWSKLKSGTFYNPVHHRDEIDGGKLLIFHAQDDRSVRWNEVADFAKHTKSTIRLFKKGGHLKTIEIVPKYWNQIKKFLS